jgi:hypothetical protein
VIMACQVGNKDLELQNLYGRLLLFHDNHVLHPAVNGNGWPKKQIQIC